MSRKREEKREEGKGWRFVRKDLTHEEFLRRGKDTLVGFEQYHEPANELSQETRTFARIIASLQEECEAINWYQQRISVEKDPDARKIMQHAQEEEFLHFSMDLEFLLRRTPKWRAAAQNILFRSGDIVANAERGEDTEEKM
jgi:hypothetical protein